MIAFFRSTITHRLHIEPFGNVFFNSIKSATCDKQDVLCIDFDKLLIGVFSTAFWGYIDNRSLEKFQQCLLNTFARNITGNRWIIAFTSNFIDLINKHNAFFRLALVIIGRLQKSSKYAFHVFPHIACLCQHGSINNRQGHIEHFGNRFGDERFTRSRFSNHQDITFLDFYIAFWLKQALVVVIDRYGQHLFGVVLTDDIII